MKKCKSFINKSIFLFTVAFLSFQNSLFAQNQVELIVSGIADDKEKATLQALRSALEQTYGCFISSNTKVLDDILVNDEIITISQGSIVSYEEISAVNLHDNKVQVTLKVKTSISDLASYTQSKGISYAAFNGSILGSNLKLYELNKRNEVKTLKNLYEALINLPMVLDFNLNIGKPQKDDDLIHIPFDISLSLNHNFEILAQTFYTTLISISEFNKKNKKSLDEMGVRGHWYYFSGKTADNIWSEKSPLALFMLNEYTWWGYNATDYFSYLKDERRIRCPFTNYSGHFNVDCIIDTYIKRISLTDNLSFPQETKIEYSSKSELNYSQHLNYTPKKDGTCSILNKAYAVFHLDIGLPLNDIAKYTKFEVIQTDRKECLGSNFIEGRLVDNSHKPSYIFEKGKKIMFDHDGRIIY